MKKRILSLLILGLSIGMVGCGGEKQVEKGKEEIPKQFEVLSNESIGVAYGELIIVKHKETGKKFIIYDGGRNGGICPLD